jgi:hypothetical protein
MASDLPRISDTPDGGCEITHVPSVYDPTEYDRVNLRTWADTVAHFSAPVALRDKMKGALFGPYRVVSGAPIVHNPYVEAMTLAVFDVDKNPETGGHTTRAAVQRCEDALISAGLAHLWYSSFSHGHPDRPADAVSLRLILPLSAPVAPHLWTSFRRAVAAQYHVPTVIDETKGVRHLYFLPSYHPSYSAAPEFRSYDGAPLPTTGWVAPPARRPVIAAPVLDDEEFPETGDDMPTVRARVEQWADAREASGNSEKAKLLRQVLDGAALTEGPRGRNRTLAEVIASIVTAIHPQPLDTYLELLGPCIEATGHAGSRKVNLGEARRQVYSAVRKHLAQENLRRAELGEARRVREESVAAAKNYIVKGIY